MFCVGLPVKDVNDFFKKNCSTGITGISLDPWSFELWKSHAFREKDFIPVSTFTIVNT